jgi:hypothetical protein
MNCSMRPRLTDLLLLRSSKFCQVGELLPVGQKVSELLPAGNICYVKKLLSVGNKLCPVRSCCLRRQYKFPCSGVVACRQ